ncbi:hypothetical protein FS837_006917 [Tulasnella sp. UAMH 9824]|nr:hypothetical protein FS837_006917 [Tulasnella sp. UAMH 9824]
MVLVTFRVALWSAARYGGFPFYSLRSNVGKQIGGKAIHVSEKARAEGKALLRKMGTIVYFIGFYGKEKV